MKKKTSFDNFHFFERCTRLENLQEFTSNEQARTNNYSSNHSYKYTYDNNYQLKV